MDRMTLQCKNIHLISKFNVITTKIPSGTQILRNFNKVTK